MDLLTLTTSGAYFYPGASETLSERKFADFGRKNDRRRGLSLITAAGSHRQQKEQTAGTHGRGFVGCLLCVRGLDSVVLKTLFSG